MLYYLFEYIENHYQLSGAGLFKFITFRAAIAFIFSLLISTIYGKKIINYLRRKQVGETVRELGLDGQIQKLREKSLQLQEKTRAKLQAQLEHFKKERDTLVPRIEKLRDNSELAWQDIKENIQKVIEDLNTSVDTIQ